IRYRNNLLSTRDHGACNVTLSHPLNPLAYNGAVRLQKRFSWLLVIVAGIAPARAQDNYEIQVYPGDTVDARSTMIELHSNYTIKGEKKVVDGLEPTDGAVHETKIGRASCRER